MSQYGWCKSERAYVAWLRQALRRIWSKHPVKLEMLKKNRRRLENKKTGRMVFMNQCAHCQEWFPPDNVEVNHKATVGTLTLNNLGEHAERLLLVKEDDLEILCMPCHGIVTYSERSGMTAEESAIEKQVIAFFNKYPASEQKRRFELAGLDPAKTAAARRIQLRTYLRDKARNA